MVRMFLTLLFGGILLAMLAVTTYASLDRSIFHVGSQLTSDPWFHATLADAYFGFLTFYVWVAYKEPRLWRKAVWLLLIMALGNIAMSLYVLLQLGGIKKDQKLSEVLLRRPDGSRGTEVVKVG